MNLRQFREYLILNEKIKKILSQNNQNIKGKKLENLYEKQEDLERIIKRYENFFARSIGGRDENDDKIDLKKLITKQAKYLEKHDYKVVYTISFGKKDYYKALHGELKINYKSNSSKTDVADKIGYSFCIFTSKPKIEDLPQSVDINGNFIFKSTEQLIDFIDKNEKINNKKFEITDSTLRMLSYAGSRELAEYSSIKCGLYDILIETREEQFCKDTEKFLRQYTKQKNSLKNEKQESRYL